MLLELRPQEVEDMENKIFNQNDYFCEYFIIHIFDFNMDKNVFNQKILILSY